MKPLKCRIKAYIQPFERRLAIAELSALAGSEPEPLNGSYDTALDFQVDTRVTQSVLRSRLAYWEHIRSAEHLTTQVLREATVNVVRNGIALEELERLVPFRKDIPLPNRRCLRYGTHGIHEYRGKFFPQLVRSLINIAGVSAKGVVADPMCGSGTTIVETVLSGCNGLGIDINPLSVLMSRTKCALLSADPTKVSRTYQDLRDQLVRARPSPRSSRLPYFSALPSGDQAYLKRWFSQQVLFDLDQIATAISTVRNRPVRDLMRLSLSNVLRSVSWQKNDDLRVRKEVRLDDEIDPIREFLEELGRSIRTVLAFLYQNKAAQLGSFAVCESDAKRAAEVWKGWSEKVDVVITSPPYATALPYLDTDRLSLIYLQLLTRTKHRTRDLDMIGNREISRANRTTYWQSFQHNKSNLPSSVVGLIEKVEALNSRADVGFRRHNLAPLLSKYFLDMRSVLSNIKRVLKSAAPAYIVIGNNHTIAGGKHVDIETANLLLDIASSIGLEVEETIPMEMLVSRDIFRKNAVASERILSVRKQRL